MAHSAGSLNLTKALYKRLLHGGVLGGGEHMYIYILYSHESPFIKNAMVGSPRLNAGVIDAAASRAAPAAPISPLRQRGGLLQATAGTRHDTVMARSTVNDLVINKRWLGAPRMSMNLRILRMLWGLLHMKIGGDLSRVLLLAFKLTLVVSRWVWFFTKETSCKMSVVWQILVE